MSEIEPTSDHPFTDTGFNSVEVGTELFRALNVGAAEFKNPQQMSKLNAIAQFLNNHPDPLFLIGSIIRSNKNPQVDNLDHFASYVHLKQQESEIIQKLDGIKKELEYYG